MYIKERQNNKFNLKDSTKIKRT